MKFEPSRAIKVINLLEYTNYRLFLNDVYQWLKAKNKPYSYRHFAEELGFSGTNFLQLVIKGKRNLTPISSNQISQGLTLKKMKTEYFVALVGFNQANDLDEKESYYKEVKRISLLNKAKVIENEQFKYFSNWYNIAIRELINTEQFENNVDWIYDQLLLKKVQKSKIATSLKLLEKIGLVQNNNGKLTLTDPILTTGSEVQNLALKTFFQEMIEMSKKALVEVEKEKREFGSQTLCISQSAFLKIKAALQDVRRDILEIVDQDTSPTEVYQINIQAFPLIRGKK